MTTIFVSLMPLFGMIVTGWFVARCGILGQQFVTEINRYIVWLALPALQFIIIVKADTQKLWQPDIIFSFLSGALVSVMFSFFFLKRNGHNFTDSSIISLSAGYSNIGFIGFPLLELVMGESGMIPATICSLITMCLIFTLSIMLIEFSLKDDLDKKKILLKSFKVVLTNPIVFSSILALFLSITKQELNASVEKVIITISQTAPPCALISLGVFISIRSKDLRKLSLDVVLVSLIKNIIHPMITVMLMMVLFRQSLESTRLVALMAALPSGTGAFMLADYYRRDAQKPVQIIILSTFFSALSIPLILAIMW